MRTSCLLLILTTAIFFASGSGYAGQTDFALAKQIRQEVEAWLSKIQIPDSENGAVIVMKGAKDLTELPAELTADDFDIGKKSNAGVLKEYLAKNKKALETIEKGLGCEKFAYTTDFEKGPSATIPEFKPLLRAESVFLLKGDLSLSEGRTADAFMEYLNVVRLGTSLSHNELVIASNASCAISGAALIRIAKFCNASPVTKEDLAFIVERLTDLHEKRGQIEQALDAEHYAFWMIPLAKAAAGEINLRGDYKSDYKSIKAFQKCYQHLCSQNMHMSLKELSDDKPKFASDVCGQHGKTLVPALMRTALLRTLWYGTVTLAGVDLFRVKNGKLPKDLSELGSIVPEKLNLDPFSGKQLVYRTDGNDFHLYSIGSDMLDDAGRGSAPVYVLKHTNEVEALKDIVFHKP